MGVWGAKADQGQAALGACKYVSSRLILKALWRGGHYHSEFADAGTEGQSSWLAQSHGWPMTWLGFKHRGLDLKFLPLSSWDHHVRGNQGSGGVSDSAGQVNTCKELGATGFHHRRLGSGSCPSICLQVPGGHRRCRYLWWPLFPPQYYGRW